MVRGTFIVTVVLWMLWWSKCERFSHVVDSLPATEYFLRKRSQTSVRRLTCSDESRVPLKDSSSIVVDASCLCSSWSWSSCSFPWARHIKTPHLNRTGFAFNLLQMTPTSYRILHFTQCCWFRSQPQRSVAFTLTCLSAYSCAAFSFPCISRLTASTSSCTARATVICRVTSAFWRHT